MWTSIGAAAGVTPKTTSRSREPVRGNSYLKGACEAAFYRYRDRQERHRIALAAEMFDEAGRQPGQRNGPLGHVAVAVAKFLANTIGEGGRLDPAIRTIAKKINRSRSAVTKALAASRRHGFLESMRRWEPTDLPEGEAGPQKRQTSSAYRLWLPRAAAALLPRYGKQAPIPDDLLDLVKARAEERREMLETLSPRELAATLIEDSPLSRALSELGRNIEERGAAKAPES